MDPTIQLKQPQGRVKANFVRLLPSDPRYQQLSAAEQAKNNNQPLFRGTISAPEDPEQLFEFAVWPHNDGQGRQFMAGTVRPLSTRAGVEDHLQAARINPAAAESINEQTGEIEGNSYTLNAHTIIVRVNARKVLKSDPQHAALSTTDAAANDKRPLFWLKWQREPGRPEVRGSLWDRAGRYGPFLDGNTQYPWQRSQGDAAEPAQVEPALEAEAPEAEPATRRRASGGRGR